MDIGLGFVRTCHTMKNDSKVSKAASFALCSFDSYIVSPCKVGAFLPVALTASFYESFSYLQSHLVCLDVGVTVPQSLFYLQAHVDCNHSHDPLNSR